MMKNRPFTLLIISLLAIYGCKPSSSLAPAPYDEDLSVHRQDLTNLEEDEEDYAEYLTKSEETDLSFYGDLVFEDEITQEINMMLDTLRYYNLKRGFVEGYTVQVYSGRNREQAFEARQKLYSVTDEKTQMSYVQPNFKVKVGNYTERLQALRVKKQLEEEFPSAIVIPERIYFRK